MIDTSNYSDYTREHESTIVFASQNKLKLGIFGFNLSGGSCGITFIDGAPRLASWDEVRAIGVAADDAGFEALIPVGRWKGFGGPSQFWDRSFETFTWAAGLAAATRNVHLFTTCHVGVIHPLLAAKMGVTVDFISHGRWGLNVVTGFLGEEFDMFGTGLPPQAERYRVATEWLHVVKRLWTEEEPFDFDGEFYHLKDAISKPGPVQSPHPIVMNAGSSPTGVEFASTQCDLVFIAIFDRASIPARVARLRAAAAENGRTLSIWGLAHIVCRDTSNEAREFVRYYSEEHGDFETAGRMATGILGADSTSAEMTRQRDDLVRQLTASSGNWPIVGSYEEVVAELEEYSSFGIDGMAMVFPDYLQGIAQYTDRLLPLMRKAGLRQ